MIRITIFQNKEKEPVGFEAAGHAGYDVAGKDVVCAAVSVLLINTVNAVERFTGDLFSAESDEENGRLYFRFLGDYISEKGKVLLQALAFGVREIEKNYGSEYLSITEKEVS